MAYKLNDDKELSPRFRLRNPDRGAGRRAASRSSDSESSEGVVGCKSIHRFKVQTIAIDKNGKPRSIRLVVPERNRRSLRISRHLHFCIMLKPESTVQCFFFFFHFSDRGS
jgi:hypothetical protein